MHAIRLRPPVQRQKIQSATLEEEEPSLSDEASKPLNETLLDLQLESEERLNITDEGRQQLVFIVFFFLTKPLVIPSYPLQKESVPKRISLYIAANAISCVMANFGSAALYARAAPLLSIVIRSVGMMS